MQKSKEKLEFFNVIHLSLLSEVSGVYCLHLQKAYEVFWKNASVKGSPLQHYHYFLFQVKVSK